MLRYGFCFLLKEEEGIFACISLMKYAEYSRLKMAKYTMIVRKSLSLAQVSFCCFPQALRTSFLLQSEIPEDTDTFPRAFFFLSF